MMTGYSKSSKYIQGYFRQTLIDHILLKVAVKTAGSCWLYTFQA